MKPIDGLLADYATHHTARGNVACHFVGIPLIMFGIFSMLQTVPVRHVGAAVWTLAELLIFLATGFYLALDVRLAFGMLAASLVLDFFALKVGDWRVGLSAFAVGWVFQAIGHAVYEKKSPALSKNLLHLLVGPVFLVNELLHVRPVCLREA